MLRAHGAQVEENPTAASEVNDKWTFLFGVQNAHEYTNIYIKDVYIFQNEMLAPTL